MSVEYDGLGRRIVETVGDGDANTDEIGDWECTYHFYYNGQQAIEQRNGSGDVIKQYVWGRTFPHPWSAKRLWVA